LRTRFAAPTSGELAKSPRERVLLLALRVGERAVAIWCAELLSGAVEAGDPRRPPIAWLGGRHAAARLAHGGFAGTAHEYWPRVWAARGLMYAWDVGAEEAVLAGLRDPAWRVREMAAKVARKHRVAEAEPILSHLLDDAVPRVRVGAESALTSLGRSTESG
jgi:hypothetical protein